MEDPSQQRILELENECARLRRENEDLRRQLAITSPPTTPMQSVAIGPLNNASPSAAKVALFRSLFRGRTDVFAIRWIGKDGKAGYSPAAIKDWAQLDQNGRPNRAFLPLTDDDIIGHLTGSKTVGVFPLLLGDSCHFLAVDFDKDGWDADAKAFLSVCRDWNVPAALERSRSGRGGHVWIFFSEGVPAVLARKLGSAILTRTMESRYQLGLDSYDRLFPNQDIMPKGGFGNIIALPLQHGPRRDGNSVFVDESLRPYEDQWSLLSGIERVTLDAAECLVADAERTGMVVGLHLSNTDGDESDDPWTRPPSRKLKEIPAIGPLPKKVRLVRGDLVYIEKQDLPSALLNRLLRLAAFQNPEFYRAQAMRMSTFGKPRVIRCGEDSESYIGFASRLIYGRCVFAQSARYCDTTAG